MRRRPRKRASERVSEAAFDFEGAEGARRDIARGHLELRFYGLPKAWRGHYLKLLRERLGVEHRVVASCCVIDVEVDEADAYNRVMVAEIKRRFGEGVLDQLVRQAVIDFANEELLSPPDDDAQVDKEIAALLERVNRPEARDQ